MNDVTRPPAYEVHLTIQADNDDDLATLDRWADRLGYKTIHIMLDSGRMRFQPMASYSGVGERIGFLERIEDAKLELRVAGLNLVRVKLECALWNPEVPLEDGWPSLLSHSHRYFEHHVKVLLKTGTELRDLTALARESGAHVSQNARKIREDGQKEWFVTQRRMEEGRDSAKKKFQAFREALNGFPILKSEEEFVISDTNFNIDLGWM